MKKLVLLGGGGHAKSCIDVIEQEGKYTIVGILDKKEMLGEKVLGYEVIGTDEDIAEYVELGWYFLISVGQLTSAQVRKKLALTLQKAQAKIATVVSPRAYVSKYASIGEGSIVMHDALVNAGASVGKHCIINTKALLEHDVIVESFCHISTSAVLNGGVYLKEGSFFGSNAVSKEYAKSADDAFIKAGSVFKGVQ